MIKFTLKCPEQHRFESWFASADAFDALQKAGHLTCAVCGAAQVEKAMMAPTVSPARNKATLPVPVDKGLPAPTEQERKLAALRDYVESNSDYVGGSFAKEARAIHNGDAPDRAIYGEASGREVKGLVEDGVPVAPLPFTPARKVN